MPAEGRDGTTGNPGCLRGIEPSSILSTFDQQPTIPASIPLTEKPGDRIGRYKLLEQIGEGGCGVVYVAEQEQPVRRRVALKVIKLGRSEEHTSELQSHVN